MSISSLTLGLYHSQATYSTRLVLLAIANFEGEHGAYPSHETIGRLAGGLNRRTVQRAIDELIELGELTEVRREGITNLYKVAIICPDDCDRSSNHRRKTGGGAETAGGLETAGGSGVQTAGDAVSRPPEPLVTVNKNLNALFDEFWTTYPRKLDKAKAFRAFRSALKRAKFEDILAGVIAYRNDPKRDPDYTKYPATWLNNDAWENAATTPEARAANEARREKEIKASTDYLKQLAEMEKNAAPPPNDLRKKLGL